MEILKIIPGLTKNEIEHLRQAVAGEVNKGRAVIISDAGPVPDTSAQDAAAAQAKLNQLKAAAQDLGVTVTDDIDVTALQSAITAAVAA